MNKKSISIVVILSISVMLICLSSCHKEHEKWTHKTFQGIVTEIWREGEQQFFTVRCSIGENNYNEYSFVINEDTLHSISFEIGNEIVVESDYNMNEHNGTSVPYPASLIADAKMTG